MSPLLNFYSQVIQVSDAQSGSPQYSIPLSQGKWNKGTLPCYRPTKIDKMLYPVRSISVLAGILRENADFAVSDYYWFNGPLSGEIGPLRAEYRR